jgi:DNA-binding CsgD family transcriptional regulator
VFDLIAPDPGLLLGREAELSRLQELLGDDGPPGRVLVVLGEAGLGKSVLLAEAANRAESAGHRILSISGLESAVHRAFGALQRLLQPLLLSGAAELPRRQELALRGAFGLEAEPVPADRLLVGIAALTLLSNSSESAPLLVIVDDAPWVDRNSLDVLSFVGHRLAGERISLLLGARGQHPPPGFDRDFAELRLGPLSALDAGRLLDRQPRPPRGRARSQVLAEAAGNPMALIELAKVIADDPAAGRRWAAEPLALTDRLTAVTAAQVAALPEPTQAVLLLAAVADGQDLAGAAGVSGAELEALVPAEELGLIKVDRSGVRFAHPLIRSAIYHAAPVKQRAAIHRRLAGALHDRPDRQAWHLAAAAREPDEQVAGRLEATAAQAQLRGGLAAAAMALERAAELSPSPDHRARRLASAARVAADTGQADWAEDLATRALAIATEPEVRLAARRSVGWALAWSNRHAAAFAASFSLAQDAFGRDPVTAWGGLATASSVMYQSGEPGALVAVRRLLDRLERTWPPSSDRVQLQVAQAQRLWVRAAAGPYHDRAQTMTQLDRWQSADLSVSAIAVAGAAAWLLDRPRLAIDLLRSGLRQLDAPGLRGASAPSLSALGWVCLDAGRWDDAVEAADQADDLAVAYQMDIVASSSALITGTIAALRGDYAAARAAAARAQEYDPEQSRSVTARTRHILGLVALAQGRQAEAFDQIRGLFEADGTPLHHHVSYLALADLAAAAVQAGRPAKGHEILARALSRLDGTPSPRLEQAIARASAALADPAGAQAHFDRAISNPAGSQWPFERAQLELDYGGWLRRRRRVNDAKPMLTAALETFRRLQASPWQQLAEAELRACGVAVSEPRLAPDALLGLTPQQRQIVRLAGAGLSNREIADELFLSPRTVGSHLYRAYPQLGVAGRHQLHELITNLAATSAAGSDPDANRET